VIAISKSKADIIRGAGRGRREKAPSANVSGRQAMKYASCVVGAVVLYDEKSAVGRIATKVISRERERIGRRNHP
jgi:hypothetical protein